MTQTIDMTKNRNANCLAGMECPACESRGPFNIQVTTTLIVHDDGLEDDGNDTHWDEDSACACRDCGTTATVAAFRGTITGAPQNFLVEWQADIVACTPVEAAQKAFALIRMQGTTACHFTAIDEAGEKHDADLLAGLGE